MKIIINKEEHEVVGKGIYSSRGDPTGKIIKIFLQDHKSLLIIPDTKTAYFGVDKGEIKEFNGFPDKTIYNGKEMKMANHDYQIEDSVEFGHTEGECEFWDYEGEDETMFVSVAILASNNKRSDVELTLIDINDIEGL